MRSKTNTIGKIGEDVFKNILVKNNIEFVDLTSKIKFIKEIVVKSIDTNQRKRDYSYLKHSRQHPFDFLVKGYGVEVKTATLQKNMGVNFCLMKNKLESIDFVVGIILKENKPIFWYLWPSEDFKKGINGYFQGIRFNPFTSKRYVPISEDDVSTFFAGLPEEVVDKCSLQELR